MRRQLTSRTSRFPGIFHNQKILTQIVANVAILSLFFSVKVLFTYLLGSTTSGFQPYTSAISKAHYWTPR